MPASIFVLIMAFGALLLPSRASAQAGSGQTAEKEATLLAEWDRVQRQNGPDNWETAIALGNLARFYRNHKNFAEAASFYESVLATAKKAHRENDPTTAAFVQELASVYRSLNRPEEAEGLEKRTVRADPPPPAVPSAPKMDAAALSASPRFAQPTHEGVLKNLKFRSIGPAIAGSIDALAVVESDPRVIYVGTAGGGIIKTVNAGITWKPIFDDQFNLSIGSITIAPSDPSILYVGTGESTDRQGSSWGDGAFKSMDAGRTWKGIGLRRTHHIGRIAVHPRDPNIVYVAALGDLWGPNNERGIYQTVDGGATWKQSLFINEDTGVSDIAIDPKNPNIVYAAAYERRRTAFGYNGGGPDSGIYHTIDGGAHWTKLAGGLPATGDIGRCSLAVARSNSDVVYALIEHRTHGGIYRSEDKGKTWTRMSEIDPSQSNRGQLRVDPNDEKKVWLGNVTLGVSNDSGRTFTEAGAGRIHVSTHSIWIDPGDSDHVVIGGDRGVGVTLDSGRSWAFINNTLAGEFVSIAFDYQVPYHVCGGLEDNNSWCGPNATARETGIDSGDWFQVSGRSPRNDPTDPNIIYSTSAGGILQRVNLRTRELRAITLASSGFQARHYRFRSDSQVMISPHDPKTLYYGGNSLFKSTDQGDSWQVVSPDLTSNVPRDSLTILRRRMNSDILSNSDGVEAFPCITTVAESPVRAGVLWAGTEDGFVWMSRDSGRHWANVISNVPDVPKGAYVSRIEPSRREEGAAYLTLDNHRSADYSIYVYKTADFGKSWTKLTNSIPREAGTVHVIREDPVNPQLLFAGVEFGLLVTFNGGLSWEHMRNGLPNVAVFDCVRYRDPTA